MYAAQLVEVEASPGTVELFGEWEDRKRTSFLLSIEVVEASTDVDVEVEIFSKNREDPGDGTKAAGSPTVLQEDPGVSDPANGNYSANLKELVRSKLIVSNSGGSRGFAIVRMLPKVWYDAVKA